MDTIFSSIKEMLERGEEGLFFLDLEKTPGSMALYDISGEIIGGRNFVSENTREKLRNLDGPGILLTDQGKVYGEIIQPSPVLVILGGGHIAKPLSEIGEIIGMKIWVVDDRPDFASEKRFPRAEKIFAGDYLDFFKREKFGREHFLVIVTRGHKHDLSCAREALQTQAFYVGMIGSKRKTNEVFQKLRDEGFTGKDIERIHAPIGLDIGAETPGEIAVSIGAELIQKKAGKPTEGNWKEIIPHLEKGSALATVVSARGSTPRGTGARLILKPDGSLVGTIGGGMGEGKVLEKAMEVQKTGKPILMDFELDQNIASEEGMICGGSFSVFIQPVI